MRCSSSGDRKLLKQYFARLDLICYAVWFFYVVVCGSNFAARPLHGKLHIVSAPIEKESQRSSNSLFHPGKANKGGQKLNRLRKNRFAKEGYSILNFLSLIHFSLTLSTSLAHTIYHPGSRTQQELMRVQVKY